MSESPNFAEAIKHLGESMSKAAESMVGKEELQRLRTKQEEQRQQLARKMKRERIRNIVMGTIAYLLVAGVAFVVVAVLIKASILALEWVF